MKTKRWYDKKDGSAKIVFERARELRARHDYVFETARRNYLLYDHRGETDGMSEQGGRMSPRRINSDDVDDNFVKSMVDTAVSLIAANGIQPSFATNRGSWSHQREAKNLSRWMEGLMDQEQFARKERLAFRDALISGLGTLKVIPDAKRKRPCFERCVIDEILVDDWESRDGVARELLHEFPADRAKLMKMLESEGKAVVRQVEDAPAVTEAVDSTGGLGTESSRVKVIEAWRVASYPGARDGRHAIYIEGAHGAEVLCWDVYDRTVVPFAFYRYCDATMGFYGDPMVSDIAGFQVRTSLYTARMHDSVDRLAKLNLIVQENDSGAVMKAVDGCPSATVTTYKINKPEVIAPPSVHPDLVMLTDRMEESALRRLGISELQAFGKKPADVRSQPGLREVSDIQSQRFMPAHLAREEFIMDATKRALEAAVELAADGIDTTVAWKNRTFASQISWSEVSQHLEDHVVQVQAASALSRTIAGRKDLAMDLLQSGMIQPQTALKILDIPDVDQESALELAEIADADAIIERLENGELVQPDPMSNQQLVYERVRRNYLKIRHEGAPDDVLDNHSDFLNKTASLQRQQAELAAQAMPPPAQPGPTGLAPDVEAMNGGGGPPMPGGPDLAGLLPT